jgi:hypothetical protein
MDRSNAGETPTTTIMIILRSVVPWVAGARHLTVAPSLIGDLPDRLTTYTIDLTWQSHRSAH